MIHVEHLRRRAAILRQIRSFFDGRGFDEVVTPVRISAPAPEPHIDCPSCGSDFLRASPELQMKRLLAAGLDLIYQIGPCFRDGEKGSRHNPEWYRRNADYSDIANDLTELFAVLAPEAGQPTRITVREAYIRYAGWDPWLEWDQDRFDFDMATRIEKSLPAGPVFLTDYPRQACSLAKIRGDVAERWEFYWKGVELANCFTELCDGEEQRRRFLEAREERRALGEAEYPLDDDFLAELPQIGSAAGVALGVDRLVMLLNGANSIAEVMACGD